MPPKNAQRKNKPVEKRRAKTASLTGLAQTGDHGYAFILWVSFPSRNANPIGGDLAGGYVHIYKQDKLHQEALQRAVSKGIYHYEWSSEQGKQTIWFQTTCIALPGPDGKVSGVLCLSRDISRLGSAYVAGKGLKEWAAPKTFSQILLAAREAERKEISKALHDEVGSSSVILTALLSLIRMNVKKGNTKRALKDIEQLDQQIKQGVERLRSIIVSLRPPTLDNPGGLCGAIEELLEHISTLSHVPYKFQCKAQEEIALSENVRILLFRIVQEALTNIVKHARAKHIVVRLRRVGSKVRLQVEDDGIGFNPEQSKSIAHVGLLAMKDSVELLGGNIRIKSALGKGTRIEVECPSVVYGGK